MARGWRQTELSPSSALFRVARVLRTLCVSASYLSFLAFAFVSFFVCFLSFCRFLFFVPFYILSLEFFCRCSSDLFPSSRPRTGPDRHFPACGNHIALCTGWPHPVGDPDGVPSGKDLSGESRGYFGSAVRQEAYEINPGLPRSYHRMPLDQSSVRASRCTTAAHRYLTCQHSAHKYELCRYCFHENRRVMDEKRRGFERVKCGIEVRNYTFFK